MSAPLCIFNIKVQMKSDTAIVKIEETGLIDYPKRILLRLMDLSKGEPNQAGEIAKNIFE